MCRSIFMYLKAGGGEEKERKGKKEMQTMKRKEGDRWRKTRGSELGRKRKRKRDVRFESIEGGREEEVRRKRVEEDRPEVKMKKRNRKKKEKDEDGGLL